MNRTTNARNFPIYPYSLSNILFSIFHRPAFFYVLISDTIDMYIIHLYNTPIQFRTAVCTETFPWKFSRFGTANERTCYFPTNKKRFFFLRRNKRKIKLKKRFFSLLYKILFWHVLYVIWLDVLWCRRQKKIIQYFLPGWHGTYRNVGIVEDLLFRCKISICRTC